jgi:hypothetical protein
VVSVGHACIACARAVGAVGAGLSMARGIGLREPVFATDPRMEELEELQFTLGQGPSVDAAHGDHPVLVADLADAGSRERWPVFAPAAAGRGIRGLFSIPIQTGAVRVGVLGLYRLREGPLDGVELADVLAYADAVLVLALDHRGGVASDLETLGDGGLADRRAEVHQATGMLSVQLGVDVTEALVRLRAYAYLHDRGLAETAGAVVARRLRFNPDGNTSEDSGEDPGDVDEPRDNGN